MAGKGIEDDAVVLAVGEAPLVHLAVHLDQEIAKRAKRAAADRRIVDMRAAAAVAAETAADDDLGVAGRQVLLTEQGLRGMVVRGLKARGDRALVGAGADEPALGPGTEHQPQRIEHDGFTGTGLAGEHGQPTVELEIEPVDQHDVADGQAQQHDRRSAGPRDVAASTQRRRAAATRPQKIPLIQDSSWLAIAGWAPAPISA